MRKIKIFLARMIIFFKNSVWYTLIFICLLTLYLIASFVKWFSRFIPKKIVSTIKPLFEKIYLVILKLDSNKETISKINIIEIAIRNMSFKKSRSIITVGGMAVGICATVFLVSLGYGVQELVISRVARLEEMKQINISVPPSSNFKINDKVLASFQEINKVKQVLPIIAVAGKVNYQNSSTDVVAYGVTTDYLEQSAIKPTVGKIFKSYDLVHETVVEGVFDEFDEEIIQNKEEDSKVNFSIEEGVWLRVRQDSNTDAKILGYTKAQGLNQEGKEVEGEIYKNEKKLESNKWIYSKTLLWEKINCEEEESNCEEGQYRKILLENGEQSNTEGYFAEIGIEIGDKKPEPFVLAAETENENIDNSSEDGIDWIELDSETDGSEKESVKKVPIREANQHEAVVNSQMLDVLNINKEDAVGKVFEVSFIVTGNLIGENEDKIESELVEYTVVGITSDEDNPAFYVPFIDLRSLGIVNYSQVKMMVESQEDIKEVREKIGAMGYTTQSAVDTVDQINNFFQIARIILALLGMIALSVAALGMFNTLTVSLLERTREVGLMKALGMRSSEIRELFLTESMIMGFFGGVLGIFLGFVSGKLFGFILSIFTVYKGAGFIDVSFIPGVFILFILFLSLVVGLGTGIYPAKRATKISALNALRYE